jgi:Plavaka transposase
MDWSGDQSVQSSALQATSITHVPPLSAIPILTPATRTQKHCRIPATYDDVHPEGPAPLTPIHDPVAPPMPSICRVILHVRDCLRTGVNRFNLLREYLYRPSYDPDHVVSLNELSDYSTRRAVENKGDTDQPSNAPWPFKNSSIYLLMEWMITGSNKKSIGEVDRLVKDVLCAKEFRVEDLHGFSAQRENQRLDDCSTDPVDSKLPLGGDGWIESDVTISVPTGLRDPSGKGLPFSIPGLHYRSLLATIKAALVDTTSQRFHFSPFKRIWKHPDGSEERVFDEVYTSDAWLEAHNILQKQRNEPECKLEKVILGLMFWSDSTHLASFGTASVWPLYMYFANLSKYLRGKPGSGAAHHVAYIPSVRLFGSAYICH